MLKFTLLPIGLIVLFVIVGLVMFSPDLKVKYLMWRGRHRDARKFIELMLDENPMRIKLYPQLAEIYYFEKRTDKRAIRVFETILHFRIPFQWRNDIMTIVAKHYIDEGRKDTEAITLIEKAVEKELLRLR